MRSTNKVNLFAKLYYVRNSTMQNVTIEYFSHSQHDTFDLNYSDRIGLRSKFKSWALSQLVQCIFYCSLKFHAYRSIYDSNFVRRLCNLGGSQESFACLTHFTYDKERTLEPHEPRVSVQLCEQYQCRQSISVINHE